MVAALAPLLAPALVPLATAALDLIDRFIPDPMAQEKAKREFLSVLMQADVAQLEVNKAEAAHASIFVAGWRPFIGWVCGGGIVYSFLVAPIIQGIVTIWSPGFVMPVVDGHLWELVLGMLGMGALRSFDKYRSSDTKSIAPIARDVDSVAAGIRSGK